MPDTEVLKPRSIAGLRLQHVVEREPFINMMLYGESGVGKTYLAGQADSVPGMAKALLIDVEGGAFTLRNVAPNIDVVRIQNWVEMENLYSELQRGRHEYKTVIIDSLTEIQKFSMYSIMARVVEKEPDRDPDIPSVREWGKNIEHIRLFVRRFRDLPMNTIFTALMKMETDKKKGVTYYYPYLSGKLASEVAAFLDEVFYYYKKEVNGEQRRLLLTQKTDDTVAKDRSGNLEQVILDPTMADLYGQLIPASQGEAAAVTVTPPASDVDVATLVEA